MDVFLNIDGDRHEVSDQELAVLASNLEDKPHNQSLFDRLSHHPEYNVRLEVSEKRNLGAETVTYLMNDISSEIHMNLISSPVHLQSEGMTVDLLLGCVAQGVVEILTEIAQHIDQLTYNDSEKMPLIEALASHPSVRVRKVLAGNTFLPIMWIERLRSDKDAQVAHRAERSLVVQSERLWFKESRELGDNMSYSDLAVSIEQMSPISDLMMDNYRELEELYATKTERISSQCFNWEKGDRLKTGFDDFDHISGGLKKGEFSIIAGAKGSGLTTLALNIAAYNGLCVEVERGVAIFSNDLPREKLSMRLLSIKSRVTMRCMEAGTLKAGDWRALASASGFLADSTMYVAHDPNISVYEIRSICLRMHKEGKEPGLLIIDNLGMLNSCLDPVSREKEFDEISRVLKQLALEINAPVLALAEIKQAGLMPAPTDFRVFSSVLNKESHTILLLYRQGEFAELSIAKHPELSSGKAFLIFNEELLTFENSKHS